MQIAVLIISWDAWNDNAYKAKWSFPPLPQNAHKIILIFHTHYVDILHQFISISNPNIIFWFCVVPCRTSQFTVFLVILSKKQDYWELSLHPYRLQALMHISHAQQKMQPNLYKKQTTSNSTLLSLRKSRAVVTQVLDK